MAEILHRVFTRDQVKAGAYRIENEVCIFTARKSLIPQNL